MIRRQCTGEYKIVPVRRNLRGEVYLHRSCVPLDEADLDTLEDNGRVHRHDRRQAWGPGRSDPEKRRYLVPDAEYDGRGE